MLLKVFFDGGCRPNPGMMEVAVVARGKSYLRPDLGYGSSFDAEWLALIEAATIAADMGEPCVLLGDAATVVNQAIGKGACRGAALEYLERFRALLPAGSHVRYIKRTQNLAGIALEGLRRR